MAPKLTFASQFTEPTGNLHDVFERKAREGDGTFAIAYAFMELAKAERRAADALDRLGLNYGSNTEQPGAVEKLVCRPNDWRELRTGQPVRWKKG